MDRSRRDKYTVQVPMHQPFLAFPEMLADFFYFVAPVGFDPKHPVGTGPFKYESFEPGVQVYLPAMRTTSKMGYPTSMA